MTFEHGIPGRKVPFTAAVLIPPQDLWEPIQAIRREHDPNVRRWMPHISLLYPFVPEESLAQAAALLGTACAAMVGFTVRLCEFGCFVHNERTATLWLRPDPPDPARRLHAELLGVLPWCDDTTRYEGGFTPHLSVGRWRPESAPQAMAELARHWRPMAWRVDRVCLIARPPDDSGPFTVRHELLLGAERSEPALTDDRTT